MYKKHSFLILIMAFILMLTCSCKIINYVIPARLHISDYTKVESFRITNCVYKDELVYEYIISFNGDKRTLEKIEFISYGMDSNALDFKVLSASECEELREMINDYQIITFTCECYDELDYHNNSVLLMPNELCRTFDNDDNKIKKLYIDLDARFFGNYATN